MICVNFCSRKSLPLQHAPKFDAVGRELDDPSHGQHGQFFKLNERF